MTFRIPTPMYNGRCSGATWCGYCGFCHDTIYKGLIELAEQGKVPNPGSLYEWQKQNYASWYKRGIKERKEKVLLEREWLKTEVNEVKHRLWTISWPNLAKGRWTKAEEKIIVEKRLEPVLQMCREDKYGMGKSWMVVENFSKKSPNGGNMHCHILVIDHCMNPQGRKPQGDGKKIAKFCGVPENAVDWGKPLKRHSDFKHNLDYIEGHKSSQEKCDFTEMDYDWRVEMGLRNVYVFMEEGEEKKWADWYSEKESENGKGESG